MLVLLSLEKQTVSDAGHDEAAAQTGYGQQQGLQTETAEIVDQIAVGTDAQPEEEQQKQNGDADGLFRLVDQNDVAETIAQGYSRKHD